MPRGLQQPIAKTSSRVALSLSTVRNAGQIKGHNGAALQFCFSHAVQEIFVMSETLQGNANKACCLKAAGPRGLDNDPRLRCLFGLRRMLVIERPVRDRFSTSTTSSGAVTVCPHEKAPEASGSLSCGLNRLSVPAYCHVQL